MRACAAFDVSALMAYAGLSLAAACEQVLMRKLPADSGGMIAVSARARSACLSTPKACTGAGPGSVMPSRWPSTGAECNPVEGISGHERKKAGPSGPAFFVGEGA